MRIERIIVNQLSAREYLETELAKWRDFESALSLSLDGSETLSILVPNGFKSLVVEISEQTGFAQGGLFPPFRKSDWLVDEVKRHIDTTENAFAIVHFTMATFGDPWTKTSRSRLNAVGDDLYCIIDGVIGSAAYVEATVRSFHPPFGTLVLAAASQDLQRPGMQLAWVEQAARDSLRNWRLFAVDVFDGESFLLVERSI